MYLPGTGKQITLQLMWEDSSNFCINLGTQFKLIMIICSLKHISSIGKYGCSYSSSSSCSTSTSASMPFQLYQWTQVSKLHQNSGSCNGFWPTPCSGCKMLIWLLAWVYSWVDTRVGKVPCLLVQLLQATINLPVIIWPECGFPSSIWLVHSPLYKVRWIGLLLMTPKTCDNYR